jgi:hypothetical protein
MEGSTISLSKRGEMQVETLTLSSAQEESSYSQRLARPRDSNRKRPARPSDSEQTMSPLQSNERMDLASSPSSLPSAMRHARAAMKDVEAEARPVRSVQSSPFSCLAPSSPSFSSSEAPPLLNVFALTRSFLNGQVSSSRSRSFTPRYAVQEPVEDDGGVEINHEDSLRQSYDLSRV